MNEILVARNELAATLTSSAVAKSVTTTGQPASMTGSNAARSACLGPRRAHPEDQPVRAQGVLDREALAQELRVPGELDVAGAPPGASDATSSAIRCGGAGRDGRLADDQRRAGSAAAPASPKAAST